MAEKYTAYKEAMDIALAVLPSAAANRTPDKELANHVADFIETLASRLAEIKPTVNE